MVGVGFTDRNDSFDFIAALEDFKKSIRIDKGIDKPKIDVKNQDFTLKEGEKISLNIPGVTGK